MHKKPRSKVVRFIERDNDNPIGSASRELWPKCWSAELACGHIVNLGVQQTYRPKRMACLECDRR